MTMPVTVPLIMPVPTWTYQQFDADLTAEIPAEGYGGWRQAELPLALAHTAVVVMHAWDCGEPEQHPGWFRAVEYLPRSYRIAQQVFPPLLSAVRRAGLPVLHVVGGRDYWSHVRGFRDVPDQQVTELRAETDPVHDQLRTFRAEQVFPGSHNTDDIRTGQSRLDFLPDARPVADEPVAATSAGLVELCRERQVNHLLYTGFALDGCLLTSPGGMVDLGRQGFLCSTIREAVTSVENRETARGETAKQLALWRVALLYGFVYGVDDLIGALDRVTTD